MTKDELVRTEAQKLADRFLQTDSQRAQHGRITQWRRAHGNPSYLYCIDKIQDVWVDLKVPEDYNELVMLYNKARTARLNCGSLRLGLNFYTRILNRVKAYQGV